ncbi:MAG TPA: hypothetical protein VF263_13660 [Longimicrobiaceae bacterium]
MATDYMTREERETDLRRRFEEIKAKKKPTSMTALAREAGINRTYLYTFRALAAEVSAYAKKSQPRISHQAGRLSRSAARSRELDARMRREHKRWSTELPKLRARYKKRGERIQELEAQLKPFERIRRAYELLLLLAYEAGVSPRELEDLQKRATADDAEGEQ